MQVLVNIPDNVKYAVTAARLAYNASLPPARDESGNQVPNPAAITTDEGWIAFVNESAVKGWAVQYAAPPAPPPEPPPIVIDGVPQSVTRKQGLKALARAHQIGAAGPISEATIQAAIEAMPEETDEQRLLKADMQIEFKGALTWRRQNPFLLAMVGVLGLTSEQVDGLFKLAATFTE